MNDAVVRCIIEHQIILGSAVVILRQIGGLHALEGALLHGGVFALYHDGLVVDITGGEYLYHREVLQILGAGAKPHIGSVENLIREAGICHQGNPGRLFPVGKALPQGAALQFADGVGEIRSSHGHHMGLRCDFLLCLTLHGKEGVGLEALEQRRFLYGFLVHLFHLGLAVLGVGQGAACQHQTGG